MDFHFFNAQQNNLTNNHHGVKMRGKSTILFHNVEKAAIMIAFIATQSICAGYGDPSDGLPLRNEREVLLMTNAVRMAPEEFRDKYMPSTTILLPANYPAVAPLWYNEKLYSTSHSHSADMASNCGLAHNSCDGTDWAVRIKTQYSTSSSIAENVATGMSGGLATVIQWLRDDANGVPAADKAANNADGHRKNIMNSSYHEIGCGYAYSSSRDWNHFWTQDFGGAAGSGYKIPAASHFIETGKTSILNFAANYYDKSGAAPLKAIVNIDGTEYNLTLFLGKESAGTYNYSMSNDKKNHIYHFEFTDGSGAIVRYPENAYLSTLSDSAVAVVAGKSNKPVKKLRNAGATSAKNFYYRLNGIRIPNTCVKKRNGTRNASEVLLLNSPENGSAVYPVIMNR